MAAVTVHSDFGVQVGWTQVPNSVPTDGQQWKSLLGSFSVQLQVFFFLCLCVCLFVFCQTLGYV